MDLVSLVIGIVALVLAVIALPRWGRPRLSLLADDFTGPEGRILVIKVKNLPTPRWAKPLGIERQTGQIQATFDIQERGTNKFVARSIPATIHSSPLRRSGLLMPALPGFSVGVVVLSIGIKNPGIDRAGYLDARIDDGTTLINPGWYTLKAAILCGEQIYIFTNDFKVGRLPHELFWV
jgi:hypothetical protein